MEEKYSNSSIELLKKAGINFEKIQEEGIDYNLFSEILLKSGLIFNKKITWVTFHGTYDLAYLIKLLKNENLPKEEKSFIEEIDLYFPKFYDIKFLLRNTCYSNYGLVKISKSLNVVNNESAHQAGNDSLITIEVFCSLIQRNLMREGFLKENINILYGLGGEFDSLKLLEYLLKNPIFYTYYYTNYYFMITNGNSHNNNSQVNYISEKKPKPKTKKYYGI